MDKKYPAKKLLVRFWVSQVFGMNICFQDHKHPMEIPDIKITFRTLYYYFRIKRPWDKCFNAPTISLWPLRTFPLFHLPLFTGENWMLKIAKTGVASLLALAQQEFVTSSLRCLHLAQPLFWV